MILRVYRPRLLSDDSRSSQMFGDAAGALAVIVGPNRLYLSTASMADSCRARCELLWDDAASLLRAKFHTGDGVDRLGICENGALDV